MGGKGPLPSLRTFVLPFSVDPYPHITQILPHKIAYSKLVIKKRVFVYVFAGDFMVFIWQTNRWMKIKSAMENYQLEVEYFKILVFL